MKNLVLKTNAKKCTAGQRQHTVFLNGENLGTLYDNVECDEQKTDYVFMPHTSRVDGSFLASTDNALFNKYLNHADGVRGDDFHTVLAAIRSWVETVQEYIDAERATVAAMLESLPTPSHDVTADGFSHDALTGMDCKCLGPNGSHTAFLTWDQLATMYGSSYTETQDWQITDCGLRGRAYGFKWTYIRNSPVINVVSFSGSRIMSIARTEAHRAVNN